MGVSIQDRHLDLSFVEKTNGSINYWAVTSTNDWQMNVKRGQEIAFELADFVAKYEDTKILEDVIRCMKDVTGEVERHFLGWIMHFAAEMFRKAD